MFSGTSVPRPRTCRTIGPRFTVSIQTLERSTVGTAGLRREIAIVARIKPSADVAMMRMRRLRFFAATPTRGTSIEERFGANPAGRTIVSSLGFCWAFTAQLKLADSSKEVAKGMHRAEQRRQSCADHCGEEKCFACEIASGIVSRILSADVSEGWRYNFEASGSTLLKCDLLILPVGQRKPPSAARGYGRFHCSFPFCQRKDAASVPTADATVYGELHQRLMQRWPIAAAFAKIRFWDCGVPSLGKMRSHYLGLVRLCGAAAIGRLNDRFG